MTQLTKFKCNISIDSQIPFNMWNCPNIPRNLFDFLVYKSNGYVLSIEHCEIFYTYMSKSIYVCISFYQNDLKRRHFYYDSFMNENRSIWTYNTKGTILIDCLLYIDLNLDKPCLFNKLQLYYFINYLYLKIINKKYFTLNNKITTNYNNIKKNKYVATL